MTELRDLDLPAGCLSFLSFPAVQVISSSNEAEHRLSAMSLKLITFGTLTMGVGHYMAELWIQVQLSLPF